MNDTDDNKDGTKKSENPNLFWFATEGGRLLVEYGMHLPFRFAKPPNSGDGHPVLVIPGVFNKDDATAPLRHFLKKVGYTTYPWELGRNMGKEGYLDQLGDKIQRIHEETGEQISIIGISLGGIYARELAKAYPKIIRQVITMGTPFNNLMAETHLYKIFKLVKYRKEEKDLNYELIKDFPNPPKKVPCTSIYTKEDGIVPWENCIQHDPPNNFQNIQVHGSHFGLVLNLSVWNIVENRLQLNGENWIPFSSQSVVADKFLYPSLGS